MTWKFGGIPESVTEMAIGCPVSGKMRIVINEKSPFCLIGGSGHFDTLFAVTCYYI